MAILKADFRTIIDVIHIDGEFMLWLYNRDHEIEIMLSWDQAEALAVELRGEIEKARSGPREVQ